MYVQFWFLHVKTGKISKRLIAKRKVKEISRDLGFELKKLATGGIIIALFRSSLNIGKKTSAWLKKLLRNYALRWNLTFIETKDFKIQFPWRNKWLRHYNILQMKVVCEKWQILLVSRNSKPRELSGVFCFYCRVFFSCIYSTKQQNYFSDRRSCRASLFIGN